MFEEKFQGDLQKNERILWTGRPQLRFSLNAEIFNYWIVAGVLIAIMALEEAYSPTATPFWREPIREWSGVDLRSVLYLVVGVWLMFAPPIIEILRKPWVYYAVTNKRILLLFEYGGRTIRSLIIESTPKLEMEAGKDGRGTLRFAAPGKSLFMERPFGWITWDAIISGGRLLIQMRYSLFDKRGIPGFADIPDVKHVYELISSLRGPD
jgi:hypothetical protein